SAAVVPCSAYASSDSRTCIASASWSAYTATEVYPASAQARATRTAISPRLAINTFSMAVTFSMPASVLPDPELHVRPRRQLCGEVEAPVDHGADDRVAAGQRVVRQEQHRLPLRGDLDRPGDRALAGQFTVPGPCQRCLALQPDPDAVRPRRHQPGLGLQHLQRLIGEPVVARAEHDVEDHGLTRP